MIALTCPTAIDAAALRLREGGLVAFPTETVYGLGADASSADAVARIYAAKGRPSFNPLIAHLPDREAAEREGVFDATARHLASLFWPGPLTLVVPRAKAGSVCDLACAGLATIGVRVPAHPLALEVLRAVGRPVAAPSANLSGRLSPTSPEDVAADLAGVMILDGGPCSIGVESTIVACFDGVLALLRPGAISGEAIEAAAGRSFDPAGKTSTSAPRAPGMLASHYAPSAPVVLDAATLGPGDVGLDFGAILPGASLDLSPAGDLREATANLYRYLRRLDATRPTRIVVAPIPETGLGRAINDRLRRAAAPRPSPSI